MGEVTYNRDQRIANAIVDSLIGLADAVSVRTIIASVRAGRTPNALYEFAPARVRAMLDRLVEYGAVQKLDALGEGFVDEDDELAIDEGVPLYQITPAMIPKVLDVARGKVL